MMKKTSIRDDHYKERRDACIKKNCQAGEPSLKYVASSVDAYAEHNKQKIDGVNVYGHHYQSVQLAAQHWSDEWLARISSHSDDAGIDQAKINKKAIELCEKACKGAPLTVTTLDAF